MSFPACSIQSLTIFSLGTVRVSRLAALTSRILVASQYAELLEAAGVDTVKELRNLAPYVGPIPSIASIDLAM